MKSLLLTLIAFSLLGTTQTITAQNSQNPFVRVVSSEEIKKLEKNTFINVKEVDYFVRKLTSDRGVVEFTTLDAVKLEQFFMQKLGVLRCESHTIDKHIKVFVRQIVDGEDVFPHREIANDLQAMGYSVIGLKCSFKNQLFAGIKDCDKDKALTAANDDCTDCGDVKVDEKTIEKFENADYGGTQLIDFNFGTPAVAPDSSYKMDDNLWE